MTILPSNDDRQRRLWHSLIDHAVAKANGKPLNAETLLNSVGVFRWTAYYAQAVVYANEMIAAAQPPREERER
jgi:hypothetical protein